MQLLRYQYRIKVSNLRAIPLAYGTIVYFLKARTIYRYYIFIEIVNISKQNYHVGIFSRVVNCKRFSYIRFKEVRLFLNITHFNLDKFIFSKWHFNFPCKCKQLFFFNLFNNTAFNKFGWHVYFRWNPCPLLELYFEIVTNTWRQYGY